MSYFKTLILLYSFDVLYSNNSNTVCSTFSFAIGKDTNRPNEDTNGVWQNSNSSPDPDQQLCHSESINNTVCWGCVMCMWPVSWNEAGVSWKPYLSILNCSTCVCRQRLRILAVLCFPNTLQWVYFLTHTHSLSLPIILFSAFLIHTSECTFLHTLTLCLFLPFSFLLSLYTPVSVLSYRHSLSVSSSHSLLSSLFFFLLSISFYISLSLFISPSFSFLISLSFFLLSFLSFLFFSFVFILSFCL